MKAESGAQATLGRGGASAGPGPTILALVALANDQSRIDGSVDSLGWVDARIAIDLGCTDATAELCRRRGVETVMPGAVAGVVARVAPDWVLLLEGHERVPPDLAAEIRGLIRSSPADGLAAYVIGCEIEFLGRRLRSRVGDATGRVRLVRRHGWIWDEGEALLDSRASAGGRPGRLEGRLQARPYESLGHFVTRADVLTTATARVRHGGGGGTGWKDLALYPAAHLARWLPGAGVRDGIVGAIFVVLDAYRRALVCAKRWELERWPRPLENRS